MLPVATSLDALAVGFTLAMLGVEIMGVLLAGWSSNNKWSIYGAMREACQRKRAQIPSRKYQRSSRNWKSGTLT